MMGTITRLANAQRHAIDVDVLQLIQPGNDVAAQFAKVERNVEARRIALRACAESARPTIAPPCLWKKAAADQLLRVPASGTQGTAAQPLLRECCDPCVDYHAQTIRLWISCRC